MQQRKRIGDLLVETGLLTEAHLMEALEEQKRSSQRLGDVLLSKGFITEQQLIEVLEFQLGIPHVQLYRQSIDQRAVNLISYKLAEEYTVLPLRTEGQKLIVAMVDPLDYYAIEELRLVTGFRIEPTIASREEMKRMIQRYYGMQESVDQVLEQIQLNEDEMASALEDEASPVVRTVNQMITQAVLVHASDIHLDPMETEVVLRFRVDGVLRTERTLPKHLQQVIVARIKIMSKLNLTERRLPQDGRFDISVDKYTVDVRVSTLPTVHGEKVVMRLLNPAQSVSNIEQLGFSSHNLSRYKQVMSSSYGMMLVTGPTGSGKTTTLYATLQALNSSDINVITVEDPVEYQLAGVNQVQVNSAIGMTFARGLRSILRQDPNLIMIGEIRDLETAEIAIRASMTGHFVLSTLHTNGSVNAITRLLDMGVEPFLVASTVDCIVAQRLVRRVCPSCAESYIPNDEERKWLSKYNLQNTQLYQGEGCEGCAHTGFKGRIAIHEVLLLDDTLRKMITERRPDDEYLDHALLHGLIPLLQDGLMKAAEGKTTITEVLRVASGKLDMILEEEEVAT